MRDRRFALLWAGETVSLAGSQVTLLALPLAAVLALDATPIELGVLNALKFAPFLLVTLVAGALVDRRRKRPVLLAANVGRAAVIALVPLAAALDALRIELLYAVAFAAGVLTVFFEVAFWSYVPALVDRARLARANGRLLASSSAADVGGPGVAGLLIGAVTAPFALAVDAASFLVSAALLAAIPDDERAPKRERRRLRTEIVEGARFVFGDRRLRPIAAEAATFNVFANALETAFLFHATRRLGFGAAELGAVLSVGAAGALLGSLGAARVGARIGAGPAIAAAMALGCWPYLAVPFADGALGLGSAFFAAGVGIGASNVLVVTFRQAVTPERLLARMTASYRFVVYGTIPLGALLGGVVAATVGTRTTLLVAALGIAAAPLWVIFSPVVAVERATRAAGAPAPG